MRLNVGNGNMVESVTVDMLEPCLADSAFLATAGGSMTDGQVSVCGQQMRGTFVSMGNPHFVIFTDDMRSVDVSRMGSALETAPLFPQRCNIEFACLAGDGRIRTRVWERGSGITMACGTGALRHGRGGIFDRPRRAQEHHRDGWRRTGHRMERKRQPCVYDRAC